MQVTDAELEAIMEVDRQSCGSKIAVRRALESVQISPPTDEEVRRAYAMTPGTVVGTTLIRGALQNFVHLRNSPKFAEAVSGITSSKHTESGTTYGKIMSALQGATLTPTEADRIAMNAKMAVTGVKPKHYGMACEEVMSILRGATLTPKEGFEIADFAIKASHPRLQDDPRREAILKGLGPYSSGTFVTGELAAELADKILKALDEVKL